MAEWSCRTAEDVGSCKEGTRAQGMLTPSVLFSRIMLLVLQLLLAACHAANDHSCCIQQHQLLLWSSTTGRGRDIIHSSRRKARICCLLRNVSVSMATKRFWRTHVLVFRACSRAPASTSAVCVPHQCCNWFSFCRRKMTSNSRSWSKCAQCTWTYSREQLQGVS